MGKLMVIASFFLAAFFGSMTLWALASMVLPAGLAISVTTPVGEVDSAIGALFLATLSTGCMLLGNAFTKWRRWALIVMAIVVVVGFLDSVSSIITRWPDQSVALYSGYAVLYGLCANYLFSRRIDFG